MTREVRRLQQAIDGESIERLVERRSPFLERFALVTALIMRRLHEIDALTEEVKAMQWPVREYACVAPPPHRAWFAISEDGRTWRQPIESHYALDKPRKGQRGLREICNYLVHHFAFEVTHDREAGQTSIQFNSDRSQDRLFSISLTDDLKLVDEVASDYVSWVDMNMNERRVIQRRHRPADE